METHYTLPQSSPCNRAGRDMPVRITSTHPTLTGLVSVGVLAAQDVHFEPHSYIPFSELKVWA